MIIEKYLKIYLGKINLWQTHFVETGKHEIIQGGGEQSLQESEV